ncbi:hypothetical protein [Streptomyces flaveolus]|uniref:hypothetical protein n=1 Tax=Streptomyces flaveolus TaxID=67297 RepID=UPI0033C0A011
MTRYARCVGIGGMPISGTDACDTAAGNLPPLVERALAALVGTRPRHGDGGA